MPAPTHDAAVSEIRAALAALEFAGPPVDDATPLFDGGLELDSFTVVELLGRLEERFGIAFADDDFTPDRFTVGGLAALVVLRSEATA